MRFETQSSISLIEPSVTTSQIAHAKSGAIETVLTRSNTLLAGTESVTITWSISPQETRRSGVLKIPWVAAAITFTAPAFLMR